MPKHPYFWLSERHRLMVFLLLFVVTMAMMIVMMETGEPLKNTVAPQGIVSLELAGTADRARDIIDSWRSASGAMDAARRSMFYDTFYIFCYVFCIALGCVLAAGWLGRGAWLGYLLSRLQLIAGLLDLGENYAMNRMLGGDITDAWAFQAKWLAIPKFLIVIAGILYFLPGVLLHIGRWLAVGRSRA
ncbi:MAG: hypothetical protein ACKV2V_08270 [Blastocatellia bacterium]